MVEAQAEQATQALPAADQQDRNRKGSRQPQQRRGTDKVSEVDRQHVVGAHANGDQNALTGLQVDIVRAYLAFAVVHFHYQALVGTVQDFDARHLVGLLHAAQVDLALFDDVNHPSLDGIRAEPNRHGSRQLHLEEIRNAPDDKSRQPGHNQQGKYYK
jgi:hypothetical protein